MSSKSINRQRQSIRRLPAVASVPMIIMFVLLMLIFIVYGGRLSLLNFRYETIETALVAALFSGAVYNTDELANTGNIVILESDKNMAGGQGILPDKVFNASYDLFIQCLMANLGLEADFTMPDGYIIGAVSIDEYRVYNYIVDDGGYHILEVGRSAAGYYVVRHPDNTEVYVDANSDRVAVKETSVYAKISFAMQAAGGSVLGVGGDVNNYTLTRLIAAKEKQK